MAALSVFHSRFFARRTSSQKELRSSRVACNSLFQNNPKGLIFIAVGGTYGFKKTDFK